MPILQAQQCPVAFADRQGLPRAVASCFPQRHDPPPRSAATRSHGGHRVDVMHVDTASDIDDNEA
eukprot:6204061-Pleurochrysis_carterae.AAC.2